MKKYKPVEFFDLKSEARKKAESLRKRGKLCRVIKRKRKEPHYTATGFLVPATTYVVYCKR